MKTGKSTISTREEGIKRPRSIAGRASLPVLCSNISKILPEESLRRIADEDRNRRQDEVTRILGPQALSRIERALGLPPFLKVQSKEEALWIFEYMAFNADAYKPINRILDRLSAARRWALYLMTGFHAAATYTDGHREMIQESAESLPRSAVLGGSSPRLLDVGIGNGNLLAATMANNPRAALFGVDIAGGSLSRSMAVINSIVDELQEQYPSHKRFDYGRFGLVRGSASDPTLLDGQMFDGVSIVLTLFAVPGAEREQAMRLISEHVRPGGTVTLVDPVPSAGTSANAVQLVRHIVEVAFRNNDELTALDVAILTAMNMHNLLKTDFLNAKQQTALGEKVGLLPRGPATPTYYGIASKQVFEKPWRAKPRGARRGCAARSSSRVGVEPDALETFRRRIEDEVRRHVSSVLFVRLADNSDAERVGRFLRKERAARGIEIPAALEEDLADIERHYQASGGYLFLLLDAREEIAGTFAFAAAGSREGELRKYYFASEYSGRGLGEKIMDTALRFAATRGFRRVYAETNEKLQSLAMFERAGFVPSARPRHLPALLPDDGLWLVKRFPG